MLDDLAHVEAVAIIRRLHEDPHDAEGHLAAALFLRERHPEPSVYIAALRASTPETTARLHALRVDKAVGASDAV